MYIVHEQRANAAMRFFFYRDNCSPMTSVEKRKNAKLLDDFLAGWLEQPGNYARFARANGRDGRERRGDIGDEIYKAYRETGGTQHNRTVKARIWKLAQQFRKAHDLACNGGK